MTYSEGHGHRNSHDSTGGESQESGNNELVGEEHIRLADRWVVFNDGRTLRVTEEIGVGSTVQIEVAQRPGKKTKKLGAVSKHAQRNASLKHSRKDEGGKGVKTNRASSSRYM